MTIPSDELLPSGQGREALEELVRYLLKCPRCVKGHREAQCPKPGCVKTEGMLKIEWAWAVFWMAPGRSDLIVAQVWARLDPLNGRSGLRGVVCLEGFIVRFREALAHEVRRLTVGNDADWPAEAKFAKDVVGVEEHRKIDVVDPQGSVEYQTHLVPKEQTFHGVAVRLLPVLLGRVFRVIDAQNGLRKTRKVTADSEANRSTELVFRKYPLHHSVPRRYLLVA
jgi:hypothetical protein